MASAYYAIQKVTGLQARDNVDSFCRILTVVSSGLAFAFSVTALFVLSAELGLSLGMALAISASFGLSTMALTYAEHVNNHILLLGVTSLLMLGLFRWLQEPNAGRPATWRLIWIGCLVGMGYAIDLGVGPPLVAATGLLVAYRTRALGALAAFVCGMAPWLVLHHVVNFMVGGTLGPANANAAYFDWPGCSFTPQNTDRRVAPYQHRQLCPLRQFALFGKPRLPGTQSSALLTLPALVLLIRRRSNEMPLIVYSFVLGALTWLMYAVNSTNSSGQCCSIRWFLPLLGAGIFRCRRGSARTSRMASLISCFERLGGLVGHANVRAGALDAAHGSLLLANSGSGLRQSPGSDHFSQSQPTGRRRNPCPNVCAADKSCLSAGTLKIA